MIRLLTVVAALVCMQTAAGQASDSENRSDPPPPASERIDADEIDAEGIDAGEIDADGSDAGGSDADENENDDDGTEGRGQRRVDLEQAIEIAVGRFGGRAAGSETVTLDGRRVHEIRLLGEGSARTVRIDAATGAIL